MKRRLLSLALAAAMIACLFAGCGGNNSGNNGTTGNTNDTSTGDSSATGEKILRCGFDAGDEGNTYDPAIHWNAGLVTTNNLMFEPLMVSGKDGGAVPGAAESYEVSEDGLTYTFHLREGMTWSDGEPLTAEDFAYTFIRAFTPETASDSLSDYMPYIKNAQEFYNGEVGVEEFGVRAVDDTTLVIEVNMLSPFLPLLCTQPMACPTRKDIVEANPDTWSLNETGFPTNGPFVPVSINVGVGITFEKNENYWNADAIKLDGIEVNYFADSNTAWSAYQAGELDVLTSIPEGTVRDLYTQNSEELLTASKLHQQSIMINNQENHLGTVALRRAVISAIDRQAIIDSYSSGFLYSLLDGIVPPGCILDGKDFRETAGSYYLKPNADLEAAAKYLEEAGYPNGEGLYTLQILSTNNESALKIAQVIQEQLKAANINAEVVPIESKAFFPQVLEGKYDLAVSGSAGSIAYPTFFLTPSHSTPEANPDFYVNPAYDEMYDKALNSTSEADQLKYFMEAERIWIEDGARLPLYTGKSVILVKPNVEGVWMDGGGTKVLAEADIVQ